MVFIVNFLVLSLGETHIEATIPIVTAIYLLLLIYIYIYIPSSPVLIIKTPVYLQCCGGRSLDGNIGALILRISGSFKGAIRFPLRIL